MEDPLTGHVPTRNHLDEEEERQAQEFSERFSSVPDFEWTPEALAMFQDGRLPTQLLVVATSAAACSLLEQTLSGHQAIGLMIQREILQDAPVALRALVEGPTGRKAACQLYALPGRVAAAGIIAICRAAVTQERAVAWVNGLFENVRAERVICLSCMPAQRFIGKEDPTQVTLHFMLETSAAVGTSSNSIAILPTGNLVTGQPAAIFSYCQVHKVPATLLLSIDAAPLPDGTAINAYARCAADILQSSGAVELGATLMEKESLAGARKRARFAVKMSDVAALYL